MQLQQLDASQSGYISAGPRKCHNTILSPTMSPPPGHRGANLAYRGGCNFLSTCRDGCFPPTPPPVYMPGELFHSKPPMLYMPGELFPSDPPPDLHAGGAVSFSAPPDLHAGRAVSLRPAPPIYMPCGLFLLFPLFLLLRTLEYVYLHFVRTLLTRL